MPKSNYWLLAKNLLLICCLFILSSCANSNAVSGSSGNFGAANSDISQVNPQNNSLYLQGREQPVLVLSSDFRYGGAEIVPSPNQLIKRHLFPGPASSFVAVTVLRGSPGDIRQAVAETNPKDWEFVVQQIEGPEWVKVTGNITPCCTNLLHSRYLFVPFKQLNHAALREIGPGAQAQASGNDEQGYILVVSYAEPLPENLPAATWQGKGLFNANAHSSANTSANGQEASLSNSYSSDSPYSSDSSDSMGMSFDSDQVPGLYNRQLGLEQRHFLQKHANKAQQAYKIQ